MTLEKEMRSALDRWMESGLSLRAFGIQEGISYYKLRYWRAKFPAARDSEIEFSPVHVTPDVAAEGFAVRLSNGIELEVGCGFDEAALRRLVGVLSSC